MENQQFKHEESMNKLVDSNSDGITEFKSQFVAL